MDSCLRNSSIDQARAIKHLSDFRRSAQVTTLRIMPDQKRFHEPWLPVTYVVSIPRDTEWYSLRISTGGGGITFAMNAYVNLYNKIAECSYLISAGIFPYCPNAGRPMCTACTMWKRAPWPTAVKERGGKKDSVMTKNRCYLKNACVRVIDTIPTIVWRIT